MRVVDDSNFGLISHGGFVANKKAINLEMSGLMTKFSTALSAAKVSWDFCG